MDHEGRNIEVAVRSLAQPIEHERRGWTYDLITTTNRLPPATLAFRLLSSLCFYESINWNYAALCSCFRSGCVNIFNELLTSTL